MSELVEVGDVIITKNFLGIKHYPVTRVTKTLAKSKRNDGYEYSFKRQVSSNMSHPYQEWSTTKYSVIKAKGDSQ